MSRRSLFAVLLFGALVAGALMLWHARRPEDSAWRIYKQRFVAADGRVIDTGNGGVSHTEGQGYAMLFAVAFDDQATFDRVWVWTRDTLKRPDGLFSWRYDPKATEPVADRNNATDGDLVICWALLRAAQAWGRPADRDAALTIATALHAAIVRDSNEAYLLPAVDGFNGPGKTIVNLSYWVFPALKDIAAATNDPIWSQTMATGLRLIAQAKFGPYQLPPDWLETSGSLRPADGFPPRFGYDAIRIPLYVIWGGYGDADHIGAIAKYWSENQPVAHAWVDVSSGEMSPELQSPGMAAVARLTRYAMGRTAPPATAPDFTTSDYYSTSLLMLSTLAEAAHGRP